MSKLRIVNPDEPGGGLSFAEACRAALDAVLAKNAQGIVILYEGPGVIDSVAVPPLEALVRGMVETVRDQFLTAGSE